MAQSAGGTKWLKYGCLGCLGLFGLTLACSAGVTGMAWLQARSQNLEDQQSRHDVPRDAVSGEPQRPEATRESIERDLARTPGKVVLELVGGEFEIKPAPAGEPLVVEARLDKGSHRLEESFESGEDGWTYRLSFGAKGAGWITSLARAFGGEEPKVTVHLPAGVPFELDLDIRSGGGWAELGGLAITAADITMEKGGMQLDISTPLASPMERMKLRASMGGGEFRGLGNASPRRLDIDLSMGGAEIDLRGAWSNDSEIRIDSSMGGSNVWLPRDVNLVGLQDSLGSPDSPEISRPTLRFSVDSSMGGVSFVE